MSAHVCVLTARGRQLSDGYTRIYYNYISQQNFPHSVQNIGHECQLNSNFICMEPSIGIDYMSAPYVTDTNKEQ
jgi:hypothetical protein